MRPSSLLLVAGFAMMFLTSCAMTTGAYPPLDTSQVKGVHSYTHAGVSPTAYPSEPGTPSLPPSDMTKATSYKPRTPFMEPSRGYSTQQGTTQFTVPSTPTTPAITFSAD